MSTGNDREEVALSGSFAESRRLVKADVARAGEYIQGASHRTMARGILCRFVGCDGNARYSMGVL